MIIAQQLLNHQKDFWVPLERRLLRGKVRSIYNHFGGLLLCEERSQLKAALSKELTRCKYRSACGDRAKLKTMIKLNALFWQFLFLNCLLDIHREFPEECRIFQILWTRRSSGKEAWSRRTVLKGMSPPGLSVLTLLKLAGEMRCLVPCRTNLG